jgi:hypothetical protein
MRTLRRRTSLLIILLIPGLSVLAGGVSQAAGHASAGHASAGHASADHASAGRTAHVSAGRKWCDPIKVFLPKPGFKPLAASDAQLRSNGFPARPPASNRQAVAEWKNVVEHAKHFSVPHPICGNIKHSVIYTGIWAGHVVPKADYSNSTFVQTQSQWTQPSVPGNSNYPHWQSAPDASFWDGIGISDLIQAGCDSLASSTPTYKCWTEDYPQNTIWEGPAAHPGDLMYSLVSYLGGNVTYYLLENETTGGAESFDNATPYVGSNAANFINERVGGLYLPNFDVTYMSDNEFWQSNNTAHGLTTTNNLYKMTSNCQSNGTVLSAPGSVSSNAFFVYWYHSSPYNNSC